MILKFLNPNCSSIIHFCAPGLKSGAIDCVCVSCLLPTIFGIKKAYQNDKLFYQNGNVGAGMRATPDAVLDG